MGKIINFDKRKGNKETNSGRKFYGVDYKPSPTCKNLDSYGCICVKCGRCGRKFVKGVLV